MSKALEAFELLCRFLVEEINTLRHKDLNEDYFYNEKYRVTMTDKKTGITYTIADIADALKNYEELTSKPVILCRRTHVEAQKLIDTICKNFKEVKITNLIDEKKVKAFDIIKEKGVNVGVFLNRIKRDTDYKEYKRLCCLYKIMAFSEKDLAEEEFNLLKEVLL